MKNLNVFTKNRLGVLMLFVLLTSTIILTSFKIDLGKGNPRKRVVIRKVHNPNIPSGTAERVPSHGNPMPEGYTVQFIVDGVTNLECINGFEYEFINETDYSIQGLNINVEQLINGIMDPVFSTVINIPHKGSVVIVPPYVVPSQQTGTSFSVTATFHNGGHSETFQAIVGSDCRFD